MSGETTTTSTSSEAYDTYLDSIYEHFGVEMSLEDFLDIDDLDSFFAQLILDAEAAGKEVDFDAFETDLEDEVKDIHYYLYEQSAELTAIISSSDSTVSQIAQAELLLEEIKELDALADDDGENYLLDAFEDGQELSAELSQTITEGESVTLSPDDPQNGQNYTLTIEDADDASSGSSMNSEANENYADLDSDGYKETNWDTDGDGVLSADEANTEAEFDIDGDGSTETLAQEVGDRDGDGAVTAADFTYTGNTATTVTIDLEEGDVLEFASWDEETLTCMYRVTKEDGTVYYITLENVTEDTQIICDTIPTNLDSVPDYISSKSKEFSSSQYSWYYFQTDESGSPRHEEYEDSSTSADTSKSYIYLEDTGNAVTIEPSEADFAANKEYTVYFTSGTADDVSIELPEGVEAEDIVWSTDADGNSVMTVETEDGGSIAITLVGFEDPADMEDEATGDVVAILIDGVDVSEITEEAAEDAAEDSDGDGEADGVDADDDGDGVDDEEDTDTEGGR